MKDKSWKEIFEAMPFACLIIESQSPEEYIILDVNKAYLDLTGTTEEELLQKEINEAFPSNPKNEVHSLDIIKRSFIKVLTSGEKQSVRNLRYDIKDKKSGLFIERYFTSQNIPLKDSHGKVEYILHTTREVTSEVLQAKREKDMETELHINKQQFKSFITGNKPAAYLHSICSQDHGFQEPSSWTDEYKRILKLFNETLVD